MNRRKFFSFLATAPVATVIGAKAAMDANGNDVAPLVGDFWPQETWQEYGMITCRDWHRALLQERMHNSRSQRLRS